MLNELVCGQPFLVVRKAKPPNGCHWKADCSKTTVTLAAITAEGETLAEVSSEYAGAGKWRDPRTVVETLAQVILWGAVAEKFKHNVKLGG